MYGRVVKVASVTLEPWNVELLEPFGIATGAQLVAENVLVEVTLASGARGLGEAAPFPAVNGETQANALAALQAAAPHLPGYDRVDCLGLPSDVHAALLRTPSALAALEMALLDASCRELGRSLFEHFGGKQPHLLTDITIPTGSPDAAAGATRRAVEQGFVTLKVKVGGESFDHDLLRLRRIAETAPSARLLLDANASLHAEAALALVRGLGLHAQQVVLFEQPCRRGDLSGARKLREAGIRLAADEDARSLADVQQLHQERAADVINFKLTKSGLTETLRMIHEARRLGFGLMLGGMVETRLAMTVSACIAGGMGDFCELDLDTPLFMRDDRLAGGFAQSGPSLDISTLGPGHGVTRQGS